MLSSSLARQSLISPQSTGYGPHLLPEFSQIHVSKASLVPRIRSSNCYIAGGTGAHTHISIHPTARRPANPPPANPNTNKDTTLTPLERSFLQSLLENLPSSTAFTLPTAASYDRVRDGIWSCGTYACWGEDNKEVAVRLAGPPGSHHFEVRTIDGTANPYIALATVLGLGLVGVQKGLELKIEAVPDGPAALLSAEERIKCGIVGRLQSTLSAARDAARNDTTMRDVLGQEFVEKYLSVNEVRDHEVALRAFTN
jgi:glutamine synthetase